MASNESAVLFDQPGPKGRKTIRIVNWIAGIVFAIVLVLMLMRLHNPPDGENQLSWELWKPALDSEAWTDFYLPGLWATVRATILAVIGAVAFGLVFGIGRLLPSLIIRTVSGAIVEFARAVPVLLLMIFFWRWFAFAGLPSPAYWAVVLALVIYNGSVVAELVRSGVGNLPNGQREASLALGLTRTQSLMQIEVPQAIYAMLPAAVTQLVVVLKDTALGSIIMYTDLLQESRRLGSMYFNILQTLVVAAVVYFIACWLLSRLAEWLPERMQRHTAAPAESSADLRKQVLAARAIQAKRYAAPGYEGVHCNAQLNAGQVRRICRMTPGAERLLRASYDALGLSARAHDRILRVARTVADLAGKSLLDEDSLLEALQYRAQEKVEL